MEVRINKINEESISLSISNKEIDVLYFCDQVTVLVKNASHRAHRGAGKVFGSWDSAINNYKSGAIKAAIETARQHIG